MRWLLVLALAATACPASKQGPMADAHRDAPAMPSCAATGHCSDGPACGGTCCGAGEACVNGACVCGTNPPCNTAQTGDTCQAAGPAMPGECGSICCGMTRPCPVAN